MRRVVPYILCAVLLAPPVQAGAISGAVDVLDGDTLLVGKTKVRLYGVDAPEMGQTCGARGEGWACGHWAKRAFALQFQGRKATCARITTDRYGRAVARCFVGQTDIAARLVADGIAEAYRRYALDYVDEEKVASISGVGIWRSEHQSPADFRATFAAAPANCAIKGNISFAGKVYHLPGQAHYGATRISAAKGERWFCSESEAKAAGWRKALR